MRTFLLIVIFLLLLTPCIYPSTFMAARAFGGYLYPVYGGIYETTNYYDEYLRRGGFSLGLGMTANNFTYKKRAKIGFLFEYFSLYESEDKDVYASSSCWAITPIFEYSFRDPQKKRIVPFILVGISIIYYTIRFDINYKGTEIDKKIRHVKLGFMAGFGLQYFISDKFSIEFMARTIYIPKEKNLIGLIGTLGFNTIF